MILTTVGLRAPTIAATGWEQVGIPTPNDILDVSAADANTLWAVSNNVISSPGMIFKTTDAGATWTQQGPTAQAYFGVDVVSTNVVWVTGSSGVLRTVDGGATWQTVLDKAANGIAAVDQDTAWAVYYKQVWILLLLTAAIL